MEVCGLAPQSCNLDASAQPEIRMRKELTWFEDRLDEMASLDDTCKILLGLLPHLKYCGLERRRRYRYVFGGYPMKNARRPPRLVVGCVPESLKVAVLRAL